MNYNEMTAAQCADWLAEKDGWTLVDGETIAADDDDYYPEHWRNKDGRTSETHPMPLTLDAAAGALREPWRLRSVAYCDDRKAWQAIIERVDKSDTLWTWYAPDRMTAEYRAAVAARMEEEHEQSR